MLGSQKILWKKNIKENSFFKFDFTIENMKKNNN